MQHQIQSNGDLRREFVWYVPLNVLGMLALSCYILADTFSKPGASFLISVLRSIVFTIVLVFALSEIWGMTGVWFTMPCTEILAFGISLLFLCGLKRTLLAGRGRGETNPVRRSPDRC